MSALLLVLLSAVLVSMIAIRGVESWRPFVDTTDVYENAVSTASAHAVALPTIAITSWLLHEILLAPLGLSYLRLPAFVALVLIIAAGIEILVRRSGRRVPALPAFAALPVANGALLGVALATQTLARSFVHVLVLALASTTAFVVLLLAAATIYERLRYADVPAPFKHAPIALISLGLMALGCMGFIGLIPE